VGANYAQSIVQAIRDCRVFLLILNEGSNGSAHVHNEINCAFDRSRVHEDITLLPFRIDQCSLSDDIYYYLGRIHIMDGALPPELLRIRELVDRVSRLLGREPSVSLPAASVGGSTATYRIVGSTAYPDSHFVGREAELSAIQECLEGPENKAFLVGMGGIGKSELARMYLKRHAGDIDVALWLSFDGSLRRTLLSDAAFPIQGLSRADFPEDTDEDYFQRKLRILKEVADRRVLIVVDNFDVPGDPDLEALTGGRYAMIFTTRCHQEHSRLPEIKVQPITDRGELLTIFQAEYTRALDEAGLVQVEEILDQLDGHPLSIRLVASTMQSRRIPPEKMNALLREGAASMAERNAKAAELIFGRLRQVFQLSTLSEDEQYLLKNLSLISLRGIPVETLFEWCEMDDFDLIDDLIRRSWVIHDPVNDVVHLHPLVSDLMAEALAGDPMCCEKLLRSLNAACRGTQGTSYEHKLWLLDASEAAYKRLPEGHPLKGLMLEAQAFSKRALSLYQEAIPLFQAVAALRENLSLQERLIGVIWLAHTYQLSGDPASCARLAEEGLALLGTDDPAEDRLLWQRSLLLSRLTEANRDLGNYDLAVEYGRQIAADCACRPEVFSALDRGWIYYHLARALYMRGDLEESGALFQDALAAFDENDDRWSQSFCYEILGQISMKQGRFEEALDLNRKARDILLPQLGPEHVDIAENLAMEGNIYRAMGDDGKARGCYAQAVELCHKSKCPDRAKEYQALLDQLI